jgi:hypothetical protein
VRLQTYIQIELLGGAVCGAHEDAGICRKRERNPRQVVHRHPCGDGYRHHLDDLDRALANDVAAEDRATLAVDDQLAEACGTAVD